MPSNSNFEKEKSPNEATLESLDGKSLDELTLLELRSGFLEARDLAFGSMVVNLKCQGEKIPAFMETKRAIVNVTYQMDCKTDADEINEKDAKKFYEAGINLMKAVRNAAKTEDAAKLDLLVKEHLGAYQIITGNVAKNHKKYSKDAYDESKELVILGLIATVAIVATVMVALALAGPSMGASLMLILPLALSGAGLSVTAGLSGSKALEGRDESKKAASSEQSAAHMDKFKDEFNKLFRSDEPEGDQSEPKV